MRVAVWALEWGRPSRRGDGTHDLAEDEPETVLTRWSRKAGDRVITANQPNQLGSRVSQDEARAPLVTAGHRPLAVTTPQRRGSTGVPALALKDLTARSWRRGGGRRSAPLGS